MWASALITLAKFISALVNYAQQQKLISSGEALATLEILSKQHDALVKANEIREKVRRDLHDTPDVRLRENDGFKVD